MKTFFFTVCFSSLLLPCAVQAQTGPGGCGTSANNVLWLNGNKGIALSGTAVTQWSDQSGNTNHATPVATTNRPTYVTGIANGNASLDFDGTDDELRIADHATINLSQWHIFIVVRPDLQKNYNGWFIKGDDNFENYELLSFSDGNIHVPVRWTDGSRTAPSSGSGQVNTTTFEIIEYTYNAAVGRDVWKNHSAAPIYTDNEFTTPATNALPLYIGNERSTTGRFVNGNIAEAIMYNAPINAAQKIIVNNYLSAKYNCVLGTTDIYVQDNGGNGNYDYDVLGIGQVNSTNQQTDSRGSGLLRILNAGNLNDNEFFICGHNNGVLGTWGSTDLPPGIQGKWFRNWRVSEVNASGTAVDVGNIDLRFDLTGLGPVTVGQLRLLVDTDNDGIFADETPIGSASSLGGNIYAFTSVSAIGNNMRFTLATTNIVQTPLPIELLDFNAQRNGGQVDLSWKTASEKNNDYFTVERSADAQNWEGVLQQKGAGNTNTATEYNDVDATPLAGVSYYRLKQTDFDGVFSHSQTVMVHAGEEATPFLVYPNPLDGDQLNIAVNEKMSGELQLTITDLAGRMCVAQKINVNDQQSNISIRLPGHLPRGTYMVMVENGVYSGREKLLVE